MTDKIFPEFEKNGNTYITKVRIKSIEGLYDGFYFQEIINNDLESFLKDVYFAIFLGKYADSLITIEGVKVHQIDTDKSEEKDRLINTYFKYFKP